MLFEGCGLRRELSRTGRSPRIETGVGGKGSLSKRPRLKRVEGTPGIEARPLRKVDMAEEVCRVCGGPLDEENMAHCTFCGCYTMLEESWRLAFVCNHCAERRRPPQP